MEFLPTSKEFQRRSYLYVIAVIIFAVGFLVSPPSMSDGDYIITVVYVEDDLDLEASFRIELDSSLSDTQSPSEASVEEGDWELKIQYFEKTPGKIGSKISFNIEIYRETEKIVDVNLGKISATLSRDNFEYELKPMSNDKGNIGFSFRILKFVEIMLGLLLMISFLWLAEPAPVGATALLVPVVLILAKVEPNDTAFSLFFSPIILLLLCGFLMAEALMRVKLDRIIAIEILKKVPASPQMIIIALMILAASFSMVISNTATAAILIPLGITLLSFLEEEYPEYKKTVILAISYSATMGGVGSLIGTPANLIAIQFLEDFNGTEITFLEWFLFGIPILIVMLPLIYLYLWYRFKPSVPSESLRMAKVRGLQSLIEQDKKYGWSQGEPTKRDQVLVGLIFIMVFGLWMTTGIHGIHVGVIATIGAILLFFLGYLNKNDLSKINWDAILAFGGGLTLGSAMLKTGLAEYIALQLAQIGELPFIVILFIIASTTLLVTSIASNTASAAILIPIFMPLGAVLGISPALIAVMIAVTCSIGFSTIIGTPPTMIAYSAGNFTVRDMFKIGSVVDIIGIVSVTLVAGLLYQNILGFVVG